MPRCLAAASIAAIVLFAATPDGRAASFDCSRAATGVETSICEDRALSALDDEMARNYRALLNRTSGATESRIKSEQKAWLRRRNACGDDSRCLSREYRARIQGIAASGGGAPPQRDTAAAQTEEKPRGLLAGFGNRDNARNAETAQKEPAEERPGLLKRMIATVTPGFMRHDDQPKSEEPEKKVEPVRQQTREEQAPPQRPLKIVGQRQTQKRVVQVTEPEQAAPEPERKKFVLQPKQQAAAAEAPRQVAARTEAKPQRKWEDLETGSMAPREPSARTARAEPNREPDAPREATRKKSKPVAEDPAPTPALTYAPENEDEPPAQRILRQEPRVQMIKPLIVRDRPPAEPSATAAIDEPPATAAIIDAPPAPIDATDTAAIAPEPEPIATKTEARAPMVRNPEPAALPGEKLAAKPQPESTSPPLADSAAPVPATVKEALKSRFDTAYGSPNLIDLLAPTRQARRFDPSRFDIFDDPPGG